MDKVLIDKKKHSLRLFRDGKPVLEAVISVGRRNDGIKKIIRGDLRTPEGAYKITAMKSLKDRPKYGTRWVKLDYPNDADVRTGFNLGLIDGKKMKELLSEYESNGFVKSKTILGHGIGIHGTDSPDTIGSDETEGCIRMKNPDIEKLFELINAETRLLIK